MDACKAHMTARLEAVASVARGPTPPFSCWARPQVMGVAAASEDKLRGCALWVLTASVLGAGALTGARVIRGVGGSPPPSQDRGC